MAQRNMRSSSAEKLSRLAVLEQQARREKDSKEVFTPPILRIALAVVGGILLLLGQGSAFLAWMGAAVLMVSIAGATSEVGAIAGGVAAAIAWFRVLENGDASGAFWLAMLLAMGVGALAGALMSVMSRRLPPAAFIFLAALLPAGLEHLGSFGLSANLSSTALTQYDVPFIARMSRLGGLAGVTYVIFLFGASVAVAVRYIRDPMTIAISAGPAAGFILVAFLYGAISGATTDKTIYATAFNDGGSRQERAALFAKSEYDAEGWARQLAATQQDARTAADRLIVASAISRQEEEVKTQLMVWPEADVAVNAQTKQAFFTALEGMTRATKCVQVAPFYDVDAMSSKVAVTGQDAKVMEGYSRRRYEVGPDNHIYGVQVAMPGTAAPDVVDTPIGKVGALLSLDANYFHNFRTLARAGAGIVAVCGYDDVVAPRASRRLLAYNAARAGVAVVRSSGSGFMMAVSPDGAIIEEARAGGSTDMPLDVQAPLGTGSTVALGVGDAFAWVALAGGLAVALYAVSLSDPTGPRKPRRGEFGPLTYRTREGSQDV